MQRPDAREAEIAVAEAIGRLMHFWGFKRPMGRLWSILYLSSRPMTATQLGQSLKMSAGAVSMGLNELEKWDAVQRTWVPGDRRDYFQAESDIWKLVRRVFRERELSLVRDFRSKLEEAQRAISDAPEDTQDQEAELRYKRERLEHLRQLSLAGEFLLGALVDGVAIDPSALMKPQHPPQP